MRTRPARIVLVALVLALLAVSALLLTMGQMATRRTEDLATVRKIAGTTGRPVTDTAAATGVSPEKTETEYVPTPSPFVAVNVVLRVNGVEVSEAEIDWATAVDGVMNGLAGKDPPSRTETLNRYVNDLLLIEEAGLRDVTVDLDEAGRRLDQLRTSMGFSPEQAEKALESGGATEEDLVRRLAHLMLVERAVRELGKTHPDLNSWLNQRRAVAEIWLDPEYPSALGVTPVVTESPESTLRAGQVSVGQSAPNFALVDAQGETVSLSDYRNTSKVVLVFYPGST